MRVRRRSAAAGLVATGVDLGALAALRAAGVPRRPADAAALALAAPVAWALHGDGADADPYARWRRRPVAFVATALVAGAVDVAVLRRLAPPRCGRPRLVAAKAVAITVAAVVRAIGYRVALGPVVRAEQAVPVPRRASAGEVRLTVVVPAYREEERIGATVARLRRALAAVADDGGLEIVVVDDGSGDGTADAAAAAGAQVVRLARNLGKGGAVRAGVQAASGRTIAFTDADLAYSPDQLLGLLHEVEAGWDVVVGSRALPQSDDHAATALRRLSGRLFNQLTAAVLLGQYRDTQCGLKAFQADIAQLLFARTLVDGFAFDVELLHLAERWRLSLAEVPVTLVDPGGSTVRVAVDALRMLRDLARVRRWAGQGRYDLTPAEAAVVARAHPPAHDLRDAGPPAAEDRPAVPPSAASTLGGRAAAGPA